VRIDHYVNQVWWCDARRLLSELPTGTVDACITDPMFGIVSLSAVYDWGPDPSGGDPVKHWQYHQPIYEDIRRVLKPGGVLAWAMGYKHQKHFQEWFGDHRLWILNRSGRHLPSSRGELWVVQTREQVPVRFPDADALFYLPFNVGSLLHPCPKPLVLCRFMVEHLTRPGDIILDCFCGIGGIPLGCAQLGRSFIACDLSEAYCRVTSRRVAYFESALRRERSAKRGVPGVRQISESEDLEKDE